MTCNPGGPAGHHPHAQVMPDAAGVMRCSICQGKITFDALTFTHDDASVDELMRILLRHGMQGFAVTFFNGKWQAGLRTSTGIGPTKTGGTPLEAIRNLVFALEEK